MNGQAGPIALVTGGSRGIGAGIAQALMNAGWRVAVGYRSSRSQAEELAARNVGSQAVEIDIGEPGSVQAAFARIRADLGEVAALINNAGIAQEKPFEELEDRDWEHMLSINLLGAVRCTREALPAMRAAGFGRIVNLSSIGGQWGGLNQVHYAAAKAALINFTRSLAKLYSAAGVTANAIAPGLVATEMSAHELDSEDGRKKVAGIPAGRLGSVEEVGAAVVYLCSQGAAYVTGQTLNLNGGMLFA